MRLEEEIRQEKFRNEKQKLAVNIIFTHGWLSNHQSKFFNKFDITGTQYNILRILRGQYPEPVSINVLKERMLDKMCDASRLVERLRKKGWLERKICEEDRRRVNVRITKPGLLLLEKMDEYNEAFDNILSNLKVSEAKQLNHMLDKLRG
jgi:DNA-binding MarR family transcriptional regulator